MEVNGIMDLKETIKGQWALLELVMAWVSIHVTIWVGMHLMSGYAGTLEVMAGVVEQIIHGYPIVKQL